MFEIARVQAVALREGKGQVGRTERHPPAETKIKLGSIPRDVKSFFDFVPLGFQLEAYVKKATREEVVLKLRFLGRDVEIAVKNLLGIRFKPGQKVVLTLVDRNPYVLKISLNLAEAHKIFSRIGEFFKSPLPAVVSRFLTASSPLLGIKNSGLFYEYKVVKYLLGRESLESLKGDFKYKLLTLIKGLGFDRPKYQLLVKPLGFARTYFGSLPLYKVNLENFIRAYGAFYELSPRAVETLAGFIELTRLKFRKRFPSVKRVARGKKFELDKPLFFGRLEEKVLKPLAERAVSYNLLRETVEFLQFLQGWSIVQNYGKAVIPFAQGGKRFFLGIYRVGNRQNISLLWEKGLAKLSYHANNPWQGELLFVLKDERLLERFKRDIENLKRELEEVYFRVLDVRFATAPNVEELFILDMADKEHSNFVKLYL